MQRVWLPGLARPAAFVNAAKRCADALASNSALTATALPFGPGAVTKPPRQGVYVHGLTLHGAKLSGDGQIVDLDDDDAKFSTGILLSCCLWLTPQAPPKRVEDDDKDRRDRREAASKAHHHAPSNDDEPPFFFDCPLFRARDRLEFVATLTLAASKPADHWALRAVALSCDATGWLAPTNLSGTPL